MGSEYPGKVETERAHAGKPPGLFRLCLVELCERAAYYGMRGLLVLFLISNTQGGPGWSTADALGFYGTLTLLVYLLPIPGGFLADLFLGQRRAALLGGVLLLLGYLLLALPAGPAVYLGVGSLLLGSGLFKPSITVLLGGLYPVGAAQRDGGFTLYYLGINIGALLGSAVCGIVSQFLGWHWGFGAAGAFMLLGLLIFLAVPAGLLQPSTAPQASTRIGNRDLAREGGSRAGLIAILGVFVLVFWACYELSGGPINQAPMISWTLLGVETSASLFSNSGSWFTLLLAPALFFLWNGLAARGRDPGPLVKMGAGLLLMAMAFAFILAAWKQQQVAGQATVAWLLMTHLFLCLGELCLSPVALSTVTRLAPARFPALTMGLWFLVHLVANKLTTGIAATTEGFDLLLFTGVVSVAGGALLLALAPGLGRWLRDATTTMPPTPEAPGPGPAHPAP